MKGMPHTGIGNTSRVVVVVVAISTVACWKHAAGQATEAVLQQHAETRYSAYITLSLHRDRISTGFAYGEQD